MYIYTYIYIIKSCNLQLMVSLSLFYYEGVILKKTRVLSIALLFVAYIYQSIFVHIFICKFLYI